MSCTPHGCFQCTEMAESATLPAMSDKGTPPPCKKDSSKPCPTPGLQPLFVPTGWLHFFLWIPSPYLFPNGCYTQCPSLLGAPLHMHAQFTL